jgi:hypothetical protein
MLILLLLCPDTVPGTEDTEVSKKDKVSVLMQLKLYRGRKRVNTERSNTNNSVGSNNCYDDEKNKVERQEALLPRWWNIHRDMKEVME